MPLADVRNEIAVNVGLWTLGAGRRRRIAALVRGGVLAAVRLADVVLDALHARREGVVGGLERRFAVLRGLLGDVEGGLCVGLESLDRGGIRLDFRAKGDGFDLVRGLERRRNFGRAFDAGGPFTVMPFRGRGSSAGGAGSAAFDAASAARSPSTSGTSAAFMAGPIPLCLLW